MHQEIDNLAIYTPLNLSPMLSHLVSIKCTFKIRKIEISQLGFDPNINPGDHVYFLNPQTKLYQRLNQQLFEDINLGKFKF
ncbi:unnamed protein product [Heterobilharzia americana]|nr:unnamed protein product [Heterobilharzia americana]